MPPSSYGWVEACGRRNRFPDRLGAQDELYPEAAGESDIGALGGGVIRMCHLGMLTARRDALFKGGYKPWRIA